MARATLTITSKNYGSWSLRGWLLCKMAELDFEEQITSASDPNMRAELLLLSPSFLVPCLTVRQNILLALSLKGREIVSENGVDEMAERFGIRERLDHLPGELSVVEQQRAAMVRALAPDPEIIIADEPTGNLDPKNTEIIASALAEECRNKRTVILASHDNSIIDVGSRKLSIEGK